MQWWVILDSENILPLEFPIRTPDSRIVRFSCVRHNQFAT
jgi:hypothetical protein